MFYLQGRPISKMMIPTINYIMVATAILFFNVVGIFGNLNIIWATCRNHSFRGKHSLLITINAGCHTICIISELFNVYFIIFVDPIIRSNCFPFIAPYIVASGMQAVVFTSIAMDLFISVNYPAFHRTASTLSYLCGLLFLPLCYGLFLCSWGIAAIDDQEITFCNPPLALAPQVSYFRNKSNVAINSVTVLFYLSVIISVYKRKRARVGIPTANLSKSERRQGRRQSEEEKAIRSLSTVVVFFFCTWYLAILGVDLATWIGVPTSWIQLIQSNMVIPAMMSYSQTYYVLFWRSSEYRYAFKDQLSLMTCGVVSKPERFKVTQILPGKTTTMHVNQGHSHSVESEARTVVDRSTQSNLKY